MKNVKFIFSIGFLLYFHILFSQRLNQAIIFGSDVGKTQILDFRFNPPIIKNFNSPITTIANPFFLTDSQDSLWMYGNGCSFSDAKGNIVLANELFDLGFDTSYCYAGLISSQAMLILPNDYDNFYIFNKHLHREIGSNFVELYGLKIRTGNVDKFFNYTIINEIVDTVEAGNIAACKKSDGAWWVIDQKYHKNEYLKYIIENNSVKDISYQTIGLVQNFKGASVGSALFSPDGTQYAFSNAYDGVFLFDFDRETGLLSNPRNVLKNDSVSNAAAIFGLAFSANSRYLYACCNRYLYQVDTKQTELVDGLVMIDSAGIKEKSACGPYPQSFYKPWLAPDCRIYVIPGSSDWCIHVIQNPDFPGKLCNFEKSAIKVPFYYYHSLPTYINEMLDIGPPCDSTLPLPVATADLSFSQIGELIVSPNPTSGTMRILGIDADTYISEINIMNMNGTREMQLKPNERLTSSGLSVDASILNNGIYVLQAITKAGAFYIGKFVVMKQ